MNEELVKKECPAWSVRIWMAGSVPAAERVCRQWTYEVGQCVTVTPTNYIYTGGEQTGFVIGFINYARFPRTTMRIDEQALDLAKRLMKDLCQDSFSIETSTNSYYYSRRPADKMRVTE